MLIKTVFQIHNSEIIVLSTIKNANCLSVSIFYGTQKLNVILPIYYAKIRSFLKLKTIKFQILLYVYRLSIIFAMIKIYQNDRLIIGYE